MDVKGAEKRKQSGVSKIAPILHRMFEYVKKNNCSLILPEIKVQKSIEAVIGKSKKGIPLIEWVIMNCLQRILKEIRKIQRSQKRTIKIDA